MGRTQSRALPELATGTTQLPYHRRIIQSVQDPLPPNRLATACRSTDGGLHQGHKPASFESHSGAGLFIVTIALLHRSKHYYYYYYYHRLQRTRYCSLFVHYYSNCFTRTLLHILITNTLSSECAGYPIVFRTFDSFVVCSSLTFLVLLAVRRKSLKPRGLLSQKSCPATAREIPS
jgi:hypothetical protein